MAPQREPIQVKWSKMEVQLHSMTSSCVISTVASKASSAVLAPESCAMGSAIVVSSVLEEEFSSRSPLLAHKH